MAVDFRRVRQPATIIIKLDEYSHYHFMKWFLGPATATYIVKQPLLDLHKI